MKFISEPPIPVKIHKMKERIRWEHSSIVKRLIDQTSLVLDDDRSHEPEFSFMVIGDTGSKPSYGYHPQRQVAELMLAHQEDCRFILHTGDVIYVVGSHEYYPQNFIEPYREFIVGGENLQSIAYDRMVFRTPILPVLGNHDYYDVPLMSRFVAGSTLPLRRYFRYKDIEIGWHGSYQGDAYARAFLDYLKAIPSGKQLEHHLDNHYTAKTETGRCLRYQPGHFTRLPNRYYTFRYGGIDFFSLYSNTFYAPSPLNATKKSDAERPELFFRRHQKEQEEMQIFDVCYRLDPSLPEDAEKLDALKSQLYQIDEVKIDIEKQLNSHATPPTDFEQLDWLKKRLIESWNTQEVRGRIVYFHHPPYVTEASKWYQAQTLAVRRRLRWVFDEVATTLGSLTQGRPIIDLILNGHAHCLEYLRTTDTGHADSHINCVVCGGSGRRPRRQRPEGMELMETFEDISGQPTRKIADSLLFIGRNGYDDFKRLPYSFVRIDVKGDRFPKFVVKPFVAERFQGEWYNRELEPIIL
ncbi:MAG: metallophosphoesterase [Scytonema sp. PMC 1069.18]|nr:metallophosphoesterase [Scytonema sp. PMC 1069.18]